MVRLRLREEKFLHEYLEKIFNTSVINRLFALKNEAGSKSSLYTYMKGYHFPLSTTVGREIYELCNETLKDIGYSEREIEFYISNDPTMNAYSIYSFNEKEPHYIVLHGRLLEALENDELKFVIGHEVGHIIFKHALFDRVVQYVYPRFDELPSHIRGIYDLWKKLGEISADRVGLIASKKLDASLTSMFTLSSGLDEEYLKFDVKDYIELVDKIIIELSEDSEHIFHTHPINPVRVKALKYFYESETWKSISRGQPPVDDPEFEENLEKIIRLLKKYPTDPIDIASLDFLAVAGWMLMMADKEASEEEYNYLINILSQYLYWPFDYLDKLFEDDPEETLKRSSEFIVKNYPRRARHLFVDLIPIITRDRKLIDREVDILLKIGVENLKIPLHEAVDMLLSGIRNLYAPFH